jgi:2-dehydropantoate 2-reductase
MGLMDAAPASFVIVGAGSVGTVVAAYLRRAGHDVTLVTRPQYVQPLEARPLHVYGISDFEVRAKVIDQLHEGTPDFLILAVKTIDTASALESVRGLAPGAALSLQNGIVKDLALADAFGDVAVVGATSIIGATMREPGVAEHTFNGATLLGELDGGSSPRVERLAGALSMAGLRAEVVDDVRSAEWSKLCQIVPAALLSALSRLPYYQVCLSPELARLFVEITHECVLVAEASDATVGDYPGFNIKTLADLPFDAAVESIQERGRDLERRQMRGMRISLLQDLERGKRTEIEETAGEIVRRASEAGISVPKTAICYEIVLGVERALHPAPMHQV